MDRVYRQCIYCLPLVTHLNAVLCRFDVVSGYKLELKYSDDANEKQPVIKSNDSDNDNKMMMGLHWIIIMW